MAASSVRNGNFFAINSSAPPVTGRVASVYSDVQSSRIDNVLPLPSVLKINFKVVDGSLSSAAGSPDEIATLFPNLFGQPSAMLVPCDSNSDLPESRQRQHSIWVQRLACWDHEMQIPRLTEEYINPLQKSGGFDMICSGRDKIETPEQFKQAEETSLKLDLDGLVVIDGDESNTNACLLAENFRGKNLKTWVIGCPKTIDGDLKCKEVATSFGFDTACKLLGLLDGRLHIFTLDCALQTHPNITIVGEEVAAKKQTLKNVTDYIVDILCKRDEMAYNYGNVQVAKIETEKMLIQMVETELEKRKQEGAYKGQFKGQSHFFGDEDEDEDNLTRRGKFKPVIKKAMVELDGAPFKNFPSMRDEWTIKNRYISPGPIQFVGPASNAVNHTLLLELGIQA